MSDLQRSLEEARVELAAALRSLAPKHEGGEWERVRRAEAKCMSLERDLARSLGEECAVEIDWPAPWDIGAPMPYVLGSGGRTVVVYLQRERSPGRDGSHAEVVERSAPEQRLVASVEFERCLSHRFGAPNDEAIEGHALHGRGLVAYRAHTVERSSWLREHVEINSVHRHHRAEHFEGYVHYVLPFHDETFECLARGFKLRETMSTFAEAIERSSKDLLG